MDVFVNDSIFVMWKLSVLHCFYSLKEIFSSGTNLKVGIIEQSYNFFPENCSVKRKIYTFI